MRQHHAQLQILKMSAALNQQLSSTDRDYAVRLLHRVCCLAGDPEFLARRRGGGRNSIAAAIERHNSARIFNWLMQALSYQGIADRVADDYMQRHGKARWTSIKASLARKPSCPKLDGYWAGPSTTAATARPRRPVPSRRCATAATNGQSLPKDWDAIDLDHLVLARDDGPWRAWWEAIAIDKTGDAFKLRWRNNPTNAPPITRSRFELALICADAA
jgi:hypothetical protein